MRVQTVPFQQQHELVIRITVVAQHKIVNSTDARSIVWSRDTVPLVKAGSNQHTTYEVSMPWHSCQS